MGPVSGVPETGPTPPWKVSFQRGSGFHENHCLFGNSLSRVPIHVLEHLGRGGRIPRSFSSPLSFHLPLSFPGGSDTQGLESDPKAGTFPGYTLVEPIEREFWALLKRGDSGLCSSAGNLGFAQECGNAGFCAAHPCNSNELQGCAARPCNSNELHPILLCRPLQNNSGASRV